MAGGQIQLVSLTKRFVELAVDDISLTVPSGEFFSLLGPSGCGKTTTLRVMGGFEQATAGRVLLDGTDVTLVPPNKRNVNTVFQSYALFPFLTVFDNVAFGLRNRKLGQKELETRVREAIDLVHLGSFTKRRPGQLSGGQQQREALARALVLNPAVLLLGERLGAPDAPLCRSLKAARKAPPERGGAGRGRAVRLRGPEGGAGDGGAAGLRRPGHAGHAPARAGRAAAGARAERRLAVAARAGYPGACLPGAGRPPGARRHRLG